MSDGCAAACTNMSAYHRPVELALSLQCLSKVFPEFLVEWPSSRRVTMRAGRMGVIARRREYRDLCHWAPLRVQ